MAKFELGHSKVGGKQVGSLHKRTTAFLSVLERNQFCTASAMLDLYKIAMTRFAEEIKKEDSGRISPMESNAAKYLKIAGDIAKDMAGYAYPKLKAVEQTQQNPIDSMTPEQKLEAMKRAIQVLESQAQERMTS